MKRYTIGVEAIIYDEIYIVAESEENALQEAENVLKSEYYDHYTLSVDDVVELEE